MQSVKELLSRLTGSEYFWVAEVFVVIFVSLILAIIAGRFIKTMIRRAQGTRNLWDDALFESLLRPVHWVIWLMGISYAADITANYAESEFFELVPIIRRVGFIAIITWFLIAMVGRVERNLMSTEYSQKPMDKTTAMALGKLLRVSVIITAALVGLQTMGFSISGVLTFGGIGGIAVGFAAKDLLANFFGGLMIYLDRPFQVGDWIRSPDKNIEGTVEDIGWRLTRIRTFDKRPLYVPNGTFTQISVENPSRMTNRRIYETVGIRYDDAAKMGVIVQDVRAMIESHPDLDMGQTVIVNFNEFAASSLNFFVYCFTTTTNWVEFHAIKQDVMLKIIGIVSQHGAECAFPTTTLHVPEPVALTSVKENTA